MNDVPYLKQLCEINASLDECVGKLRQQEVFCIDKYDREINFLSPEAIYPNILKLMTTFAAEIESATTRESLACALAKFYYGIIVIHPFDNGNRRTAFVFMQSISYEKQYQLHSLELLQKILFTGNTDDDMTKLSAVFFHMLTSH